jgi:hypothetical protein
MDGGGDDPRLAVLDAAGDRGGLQVSSSESEGRQAHAIGRGSSKSDLTGAGNARAHNSISQNSPGRTRRLVLAP